jgi:hypothetical protein
MRAEVPFRSKMHRLGRRALVPGVLVALVALFGAGCSDDDPAPTRDDAVAGVMSNGLDSEAAECVVDEMLAGGVTLERMAPGVEPTDEEAEAALLAGAVCAGVGLDGPDEETSPTTVAP